MPAAHRRQPAAAPAAGDYVQARSFDLARGDSWRSSRCRARLVAGRLRQRRPGERARRIRAARLAVRRLPDGHRDAAAHRPVRRRDRQRSAASTRTPSARCDALRARAPAAGARVAARCASGARLPPPLPHALRGRPDAHARSIAASARASRRRASSSTCRCSSSRPRTLFDYLPARRRGRRRRRRSTRRCERAWEAIVARYEDRRHDIERPLLAPDGAVPADPAELQARLGALRARAARRLQAPDAELQPATPAHDFPHRRRRELPRSTRAPTQPLAPLLELPRPATRARADRGRLARPARGAAARCCARTARSRAPVADWAAVRGRRARARDHRAPRISTASRCADPPLLLLAEAQLFGARARQERRRRRAAGRPGRDPARPAEPGARRAGGARGVRRRPLRRPAGHGGRRRSTASSWCSNTTTATASTCRCTRCTWSPLHRRRAREPRRCTSSAPTSGRGRASAPPSRCATWPRNCSTCMRAARRTQAPALRAGELEYQTFANAFPFEETADQAEAIAQRARGPGAASGRWTASSAATWASARPRWRCAPPSSPCRPAGRWRCWCRPRCSPSSTRRISATASPTGRCASSRCRASAPARRPSAVLAGLEHGTVDIVIATHRLLHADARFSNLGLHHRRRGTPLRRARQGAAARRCAPRCTC